MPGGDSYIVGVWTTLAIDLAAAASTVDLIPGQADRIIEVQWADLQILGSSAGDAEIEEDLATNEGRFGPVSVPSGGPGVTITLLPHHKLETKNAGAALQIRRAASFTVKGSISYRYRAA